MDTVESQRVLAVVNEAVDNLRIVSYITPEVVAAVDQLGGILGQDVQDVLQQHAAAVAQLPEDFQPHELLSTATALLRVMKKSPGIEEALSSLHTTRSPAMLQLLSYFERHRAQTIKCLHTTVEEDATNKARVAALSQRREVAASEKLQLEHRLKLQRLEQAKQMGMLQAAYDATAAELSELRSAAAARKAVDEAEAAAARQRTDELQGQQHDHLAKQLEATRRELTAARSESSEAAGSASKVRRRALQDCEASIGEYDAELTARQAEYDAALAAHKELLTKIQQVSSEAATLRAERLAYEEAQRAAAEAAKRAELAALRREAAVYMIQNCWKVWKKKKAAAAKAASKGGKGKGGSAKKGKK